MGCKRNDANKEKANPDIDLICFLDDLLVQADHSDGRLQSCHDPIEPVEVLMVASGFLNESEDLVGNFSHEEVGHLEILFHAS